MSKTKNQSNTSIRSEKDINKDNYLDFIPIRAEKYRWDTDEEGNVTIYIENKGVFNRLAQIFMKKAKVSQIHLEKMGSFIWPLIDGKRTVYDIGQKVSEYFGDEAEPLYPRLTQYISTLKEYGFIEYQTR